MCEYKEMAKYYDLFYSNKYYDKEVCFLKSLIGNRKNNLRYWMRNRNSYEFIRKIRLSS